MTRVRYFCCDELRRNAVAGHPTLNAIEYLEVGDLVPAELDAAELARYNALPASERDQLLWQRRLTVVFVNPLTAEHIAGLSGDTISIEGGERITGIRAEVLATGTDSVTLRTSVAGDFSRYTLALVRSASDDRPPPGFDPILSTIEFSFKIDCPSEFDCKPGHLCLKAPPDAPDIDYLAKDYASFRRLILDRMALLAPAWRDRSPADLGVTLVELLAYAGDHLSYQQDAVGDRGVPRDGATARVGPPTRHRSSTTPCTRAPTREHGCTSQSAPTQWSPRATSAASPRWRDWPPASRPPAPPSRPPLPPTWRGSSRSSRR